MLIEYAFVYVMGLISGAVLLYFILRPDLDKLESQVFPVSDLPENQKEFVRKTVAEFVTEKEPEEVSDTATPHPGFELKPDYAGPGPACWLCNKGGARLPYGICKECNEFNGVGREEAQ